MSSLTIHVKIDSRGVSGILETELDIFAPFALTSWLLTAVATRIKDDDKFPLNFIYG